MEHEYSPLDPLGGPPESPIEAGSDQSESGPPPPRIFDQRGVGVAAFLGGPVGGGLTIMFNEWRIKRPLGVVLALLASALLVAVLIALPTQAGGSGLNIAIAGGVAAGYSALAKKLYESRIGQLERANRSPLGGGMGAVVGLPVAAAVVAMLLLLPAVDGEKHDYGDISVYVRDGASAADAERLAGTLEELGASQADVYLEREGERWVVGMVLKDSFLESPTVEAESVSLANVLSAMAFSGDPVRFEANDDMLSVRGRFDSDPEQVRLLQLEVQQ
ncbi:MAG: hypothetical protein KC561_08940 [Myxococcales bacterium]|nr:hypothetical protein [Myxococcales bacterium]